MAESEGKEAVPCIPLEAQVLELINLESIHGDVQLENIIKQKHLQPAVRRSQKRKKHSAWVEQNKVKVGQYSKKHRRAKNEKLKALTAALACKCCDLKLCDTHAEVLRKPKGKPGRKPRHAPSSSNASL